MGHILNNNWRHLLQLTTLCCVVFLPLKAVASIPVDANLYIFTVDATISDTSDTGSYQLPIPNTNYQLYWEEVGSEASNNSANAVQIKSVNHTLEFGSPGIYRIAIDPISVISGSNDFDRFLVNNSGDKAKLLTIEQWGTTAWSSMESAFEGASAFTGSIATDAPDLANVTSMGFMFSDTPVFVEAIGMGEWDTTSVKDMYSAFAFASIAIPDTGNWNTSSVTDMGYMFESAPLANPETRYWDTGSVEYMDNMFRDATLANPDTSRWNISSVSTLDNMFRGATSANPDTRQWDTSSVAYMDSMFRDATSANPDTSKWNTTSVLDMGHMFEFATSANPDTSAWITSSVKYMDFMFHGATSADPDTRAWDTSALIKTDSMFKDATQFSGAIDHLDMSNVTSAVGMFDGIRLSIANYDALLEAFNVQTVQPSVQFSAGKSTYCKAETARTALTSNHEWDITDGGFNCTAPTPAELLAEALLEDAANNNLISDNNGVSGVGNGASDRDSDSVDNGVAIHAGLSTGTDSDGLPAFLGAYADNDGLSDYPNKDTGNNGVSKLAEANPLASGSSGCSVNSINPRSGVDPLIPIFVMVALSWLTLCRRDRLKPH